MGHERYDGFSKEILVKLNNLEKKATKTLLDVLL